MKSKRTPESRVSDIRPVQLPRMDGPSRPHRTRTIASRCAVADEVIECQAATPGVNYLGRYYRGFNLVPEFPHRVLKAGLWQSKDPCRDCQSHCAVKTLVPDRLARNLNRYASELILCLRIDRSKDSVTLAFSHVLLPRSREMLLAD
jgi:hypothetical protein